MSGRFLARLVVPVALGTALLVQALYFQRTTSAVWDEAIYLTAGLDFYHHGRVERFTNFGIAPLPVMLSYLPPALASSSDQVLPPEFPRAILLARVTHLVVVGLPLVLLPYFWMTRRRGLLAGAAVGALLAFSPLVIAFSAIAVTDACFAVAFLIALAAIDAHVRRPGAKSVALVGVAIGVALAAKYTATLLLPVALAAFLYVERRQEAGRWTAGWLRAAARALGQIAAVGLVALLLVWAMHGFAMARVLPDNWNPPPSLRGPVGAAMAEISRVIMVPAPVRGIVYQIEHASGGQQQFLLGQKSTRGWWYYYPLALLYKSTPAELLLAALLPFLLWRTRRDMDATSTLLALTAAFVFVSVLPSRLDIGVRYVLVLYPLLALLAVDRAASMSPRGRWIPAMLGMLVVLQASSAVAAAPRYLSYFNRLFTPEGQAYTRLVDSNLDWGQDLPALGAALADRGADSVVLAYFGVAPPQAYGIRATPWDTPDEEALARPRWIAISATMLNGVYLRGDPFREFRRLRPDGRPGDSFFFYDASNADVRQAMTYARSRIALQPCRDGATAPKRSDSSYAVVDHWYIRCTGR